jgi:drug/metabolite transporter (DMT)-like permease
MAPVATRALVLQLAPLPLLVIRMGVAAVVLLPWCGPVLRGRGRQYIPRLIVAGLLGMVGYNLPVTIGLQWVPASTAGLVLASEPVWLLMLAAVFLRERVSRRCWAGAAVALAGVALLAGPGVLSSRSGTRELAGVSLIALGTLFFAAYTLMLRPVSRACGPVAATSASTVAGSLFYAAFAGTVNPGQLGRLPAAAWGELAFLAVGSIVLGMLAWNLAVARLPGQRASLLLYLEPLVSVAGAVALLGERLSAGLAVGGALVLGGIAATWMPGPRDKRPPRPEYCGQHAASCDSQGDTDAGLALDVPGFLRATMAIRAQLARAAGLIGYALDAYLARS